MSQSFDVVVVGAGFGGLGSALRLAELGASVAVCETLGYPGGCASTFRRDGFAFEAGATLVAGLDPGPLGDWVRRLELPVAFERLDPVVTLRAPGLSLPVAARREAFVEALGGLPGAPRAEVRAFFARQGRVAETLWSTLGRPELLRPLGAGALLEHARRLPRYLEIAPLVGKSLGRVLDEAGLAGFGPLRLWADAVCQITLQCPAREADAAFAFAALDYFWRGSVHVRGGVGVLAWALVRGIERLGGEVHLANRVRAVTPAGDGTWLVATRQGELRARHVVLGVLPGAARRLVAAPLSRPLDGIDAAVSTGWGAAMLYLVGRAPAGAPPGAQHLELVLDPGLPLVEGNHVFCSVSEEDAARAPPGRRTITVSTHVDLRALRPAPEPEKAARVAAIQASMRRTLASLAPEWALGLEHELTASPRTFERFTGRPGGWVGGIPRRAGLASYAGLGPRRIGRGLWLVGDSVFLGQSVLATALGGARTAEAIAAAGTPRAPAGEAARVGSREDPAREPVT